MTAQELITTCQAAGIELAVSGDHLRVDAPEGVLTPDLRAALTDQKPTVMALLTEIGWRAAAMREQLAPPPAPIPLLMAKRDIKPGPNDCVSCGAELLDVPAIGVGRCEPCRRAAWLVLEHRAEVVG